MNRFVSYAQNCEDVMLRRALQGVTNGFYIDCGAFDPEIHSVTKAFYDDGWRGINIEPLPKRSALFETDRPRDINLNVGVSDQNGQTTFYEVVDTGLSTLSADIARKHEQDGFEVRTIQVEIRRLDDIIESVGSPEIHFLKIDVEGAEQAVLAGCDLNKHRPWIVVIEAIVPFTGRSTQDTETSAADWETILSSAGYEFVYFDGLNRFYVAPEHADLKQAFLTPPEFFTQTWISSGVVQLQSDVAAQAGVIYEKQQQIDRQAYEIGRLQSELHAQQEEAARQQADAARERAEAARQADARAQEIHHLLGLIEAIRNTLSWQLTRPFRRLAGKGNDWPVS